MALIGQSAHLFVGFNQDATSLQVGMHSGYAIYNLNSIDKLRLDYLENEEESTRYIERLFSSSLIVYILHKSPRKIRAFHFGKQRKVCTQSYTNTVVAIKMNREHVVICLEDSIVIHSIRDLKIEHQIRDVPENKRGVIDLTPEGKLSFIAYPGTTECGRGNTFEASSLTIAAHTSPLAALRFNPDGTLLATSSTKGTVIRIFNVQTGERCFEFTRGVKRYVTINCMAFSKNSKYICLSSNTETVHVFKLEKPAENVHMHHDTPTWTDYLTKAASSYLPTHMNELIYREKSFATARLPTAGPKNAVAFRIVNSQLYLLVATVDGFLYCYFVDSNGGECSLALQHRIGNQAGGAFNDDELHAVPTTDSEKLDINEDADISDLNEFPPLDHTV